MNVSKNEEIILLAIEKAWSDESFKRELINDPRAALASVSDSAFELKESTNLKFVDVPSFKDDDELISETDDTLIVRIPPQMDLRDIELSEAELELVTGGDGHLLAAYYIWKARRAGIKAGKEAAANSTTTSPSE